MIDKIIWTVFIKGEEYKIIFSADMKSFSDGPNYVTRMYGIEKHDIMYVLAILSDGTYRLYSKKKRKLYSKGKLINIKFIPYTRVNKVIH
jgi:hypothetical protein